MAVDQPEPMRRARWVTRAGAWFVDVVIVSVVIALAGDLLGLGPGLGPTLASPAGLARLGMLLFVYWTLFEGRTGQSPGKLVLDIRVVHADGEPLTYVDAGIESFGKAFLLPLDLLIGLLAMPGERQRLFNRLSNTVVVDIEEPAQARQATATTA